MRKQIAAFEFRNGAFGMNRGHITRTDRGWIVGHGNGSDPCFYASAMEAKRAYRKTISELSAFKDFSPLNKRGDRVLSWSL